MPVGGDDGIAPETEEGDTQVDDEEDEHVVEDDSEQEEEERAFESVTTTHTAHAAEPKIQQKMFNFNKKVNIVVAKYNITYKLHKRLLCSSCNDHYYPLFQYKRQVLLVENNDKLFLAHQVDGCINLAKASIGNKEKVSFKQDSLTIETNCQFEFNTDACLAFVVCVLPRAHYGWKYDTIDPYDSTATLKYLTKQVRSHYS